MMQAMMALKAHESDEDLKKDMADLRETYAEKAE
jgi:hypothetical protein